jgi:cell division protein FtsA
MPAPLSMPRMRPLSTRRGAVISIIDVGTSKIACLVAQLEPAGNGTRQRPHGCRILGIGHQRARGIKAGQVVDMDEAEGAIRLAVDAAERMAGVQVERAIITAAGGRLGSQHFTAEVAISGTSVADHDVHRVLEASCARTAGLSRVVLHSLPTSFSLDDTRGIHDPKGMIGERLSTDLHVVACEATAARNLLLAIERCHLGIETYVAAPYAASLAALVDDEARMGATVIDFGAGTTSVAVFADGVLVHVDAIAVGGNHVTMDVANGLNIRLSSAERLKTLYGSVLPSASDERETIAVEQVGDDSDQPVHRPRADLVRIIRPRVEEILELMRDRLREKGHPVHSGSRLILTGGASQLTGLPDAVRRILQGQVRQGRPPAMQGLPESGRSPAFAAAAGLLLYPQVAAREYFEPRRERAALATGTDGYFSRVGRWLKDSF